jgi:hypothetical protein
MIEAVLSALRPCARPPDAMERLHPHGPDHLLYHCPTPQPGGKCADLLLTPLELIDRIAALVPPPRRHRLRYFGALAPNSPLRSILTALARGDSGATGKTPVAGAAVGSSARDAWASLNRAHRRSVPTAVLALWRPDAIQSRSSAPAPSSRRFRATPAWLVARPGSHRPKGRRCGTSKTWPTRMMPTNRPILCQSRRNISSISASAGDERRAPGAAQAGQVRQQGPDCSEKMT